MATLWGMHWRRVGRAWAVTRRRPPAQAEVAGCAWRAVASPATSAPTSPPPTLTALPPCATPAHRLVPAKSHSQYRELDEAELARGLTMLGLISLVDPPREGVLEAVQRCRT